MGGKKRPPKIALVSPPPAPAPGPDYDPDDVQDHLYPPEPDRIPRACGDSFPGIPILRASTGPVGVIPRPPIDHTDWRSILVNPPLGKLFPPGINIGTGASHVGKTSWIALLVLWLLRKQSVFGFDVGEIPMICYIGMDRRWSTARHWFDLAGVQEGPRFKAYCALDDSSFDWSKLKSKAGGQEKVFAEILDILNPPEHSFIIVDPIALFIGKNLGDYIEVAAGCGELSKLCIKRKLTILGLCHVKKMMRDGKDQFMREQDRALGSAAISAYTNTQVYFIGPEETGKPYTIVGYRSHELPPKEFKYKRDETTGLFVELAPEESDAIDKADNMAKVVAKARVSPLFTVLMKSEEPLTTKRLIEIGSALGMPTRTIKRRLKEWTDAGLIEQPGEGLYQKMRKGGES